MSAFDDAGFGTYGCADQGPRASGTYLCLPCDSSFEYSPAATSCPSCSSDARDEINALYIEEDAEQTEFLAAFDFGEGD